MVSLKPNLASYARIAYARELSGDTAGADLCDAARARRSRWSAGVERLVEVELGKLEFGRGRVAAADRRSRRRALDLPGYVYALEQRARVEAARGQSRPCGRSGAAGIRLRFRCPSSSAFSETCSTRQGHHAEARHQQATVAAIDRLLVAGGVRVDLESAVYRADHRVRPAETVELARQARAARPSIYGDDALGWALARAGRCEEAVAWSQRSLRLGTRDALLWFHRGYAAGCAGDRAGMKAWYAKALALNPNFSVRFAPIARQVVS